MKYRLVSFDLQGTLSDSAFSDEFWLDLLPRLYAEKNQLTLSDAKDELKSQFVAMGKYNSRYYCVRTWSEELCPDQPFSAIVARIGKPPHLFEDSLQLVQQLANVVPLIILSTTTYDFIEVELGSARRHFCNVYSTLNDFSTAGKTKEVFQTVAKRHGVSGLEALHIGDCPEMDIANAQAAGWNTFFFDKKRSRTELLAELNELLSDNVSA